VFAHCHLSPYGSEMLQNLSVFLFRSLFAFRRCGGGGREAHKNPFNRISLPSTLVVVVAGVLYIFRRMSRSAERGSLTIDISRMCKENENVLCYVSLIEWKKITDAALDSPPFEILYFMSTNFSFYFPFPPFFLFLFLLPQFHSLHFT
jgi:hypothetical protein